MTRIRPALCGSGCDGIRISLERRVRLDPSILTATTTDPTPDPKDLWRTRRVTVREHNLKLKNKGSFPGNNKGWLAITNLTMSTLCNYLRLESQCCWIKHGREVLLKNVFLLVFWLWGAKWKLTFLRVISTILMSQHFISNSLIAPNKQSLL